MSQINHIEAVEAKLQARTDRIRSLEKARLDLVDAERRYIELAQGCLQEDLAAWPDAPLLEFPDDLGRYRLIDRVRDIDGMVGDPKDYSVAFQSRAIDLDHEIRPKRLRWGADG